MRYFTDSEGVRWEVEETGRHGIGARGPGGALPEASIGTVLFFTSEDGREVAKETPAGAVNSMTDEELVGLLEEKEEDVDSAGN
jgi:hypothetical protein